MASPVLVLGPVARARNGVIGVDGRLPWRLKSDLALFKRLTLGRPVIMGRKTWASLPKRPLPGRLNIVLSRDGAFAESAEAKGAVVCDQFDEAVAIAREHAAEDGVDEIFVIGGADLFALALPKARRILLTEVDADVDGDVRLPAIDESGWREVERQAFPASDDDAYPFVFRRLERA